MIFLFAILAIILVLIIMVLIIPFFIDIDTNRNRFRIYLPGILGIKISKNRDNWKLKGRILFINFNLSNNKETFSHKKKKVKKKSTRIVNLPIYLQQAILTLINIAHSISVKRFKAEIDTGDYSVNAQLYPVILTTELYKNIQINFENRNSLNLLISGQLYKLAYHILKFYIKTKKLIIKN